MGRTINIAATIRISIVPGTVKSPDELLLGSTALLKIVRAQMRQVTRAQNDSRCNRADDVDLV